MYWIIFIGFALLSWLVSSRLQNKFEKYSQIPMPNGMTGKDVAEKMLHDNGIYDVKVISTPGHLTDHYNPANQTVNLSESVYYSNSIAAAAVAAHECGHAVQHATAYAPLKMRSALVPVVSFASNIMTWVLLAGMLLLHTFPQLMLFGIIVVVTLLTWIVPAGQYEYAIDETTGYSVVVGDSFQYTEQSPVTPFRLFVAIQEGFINGAQIIFLILFGYFWVYSVMQTGAFTAMINILYSEGKQKTASSLFPSLCWFSHWQVPPTENLKQFTV